MSRLSTRACPTAAFAAATPPMLVGVSWFVYARLRADLDDRIDALPGPGRPPPGAGARRGSGGVAIEDPEESFVRSSAPMVPCSITAAGPVRRRWGRGGRGRDGGRLDRRRRHRRHRRAARLLVRRLDDGHVLIVGESPGTARKRCVVDSFAVGGAAALVLAALVGSLLARAGLRPVEAMPPRGGHLLHQADEGLPLPAEDEIHRLGVTLNEMLASMQAAYEREARFVADASQGVCTPIAVVKHRARRRPACR